MSGSGGGFGYGGFEQPSTCADLVIKTQLSSPKDEVVDQIRNGDFLVVELQTIGLQQVVVVLHDGKVVGGIASPQVQKLRECIIKGINFEAEVIQINGGQVTIRIKAI